MTAPRFNCDELVPQFINLTIKIIGFPQDDKLILFHNKQGSVVV